MAGWCIREGARPPSAGGRIARGLPRAHPAPAALASPLWRGHRFARRARRNDGGETRRLRAARIPIRTRAVAATGNGPLAPELAACVRLYVRWATCRGGMAGGASWVSSGRAGTMVGNAGASARRASPSAHGRSRQRATGRWRRNWPPASGCTCDGPRAVAGWPVVHRGSRPGAPERWWEMRAPSARRASHPHAGGRGDGRLAPERVAGHHAARSASRAAALRAAPGRRPRRSRWAASGGGTAGGASWRARPPAREAHCAAYGACTPAPFARA